MVNETELYDLEKDISERVNIAAAYPEIVKTLQKKYTEIDSKAKPVQIQIADKNLLKRK